MLTPDGYPVAVVENPTLSLLGDDAATRQHPVMCLESAEGRRIFVVRAGIISVRYPGT